MDKLRLVLVDGDKDYVSCLHDYLLCEHADKFEVSAFTNEVSLDEFLNKEETASDLVLVSNEFYEKLLVQGSGLIILLDRGQSTARKGRTINKYQSGDKLVAEVLKIFTEEVAGDFPLRHHPHKTRIIGVYSPIGGVGKTTIAVGASMQSTWEGKSVFYLNLENTSSLPLYFSGEGEENLSHLLYFLKGQRKNLAWHIESAKCVDPVYQVHYFQPPDSIFDFQEDIAEDLCVLLRELKVTKQYERIFVDFSSELNKNNLAVLQACDDLILVAQPNMTSVVKIKCLCKELRLLLAPNEAEKLIESFKLVLNKVIAGEAREVAELSINKQGILAKIPWVEDLTSWQGDVYRIDLNSNFGKAVYQLLLNF